VTFSPARGTPGKRYGVVPQPSSVWLIEPCLSLKRFQKRGTRPTPANDAGSANVVGQNTFNCPECPPQLLEGRELSDRDTISLRGCDRERGHGPSIWQDAGPSVSASGAGIRLGDHGVVRDARVNSVKTMHRLPCYYFFRKCWRRAEAIEVKTLQIRRWRVAEVRKAAAEAILTSRFGRSPIDAKWTITESGKSVCVSYGMVDWS